MNLPIIILIIPILLLIVGVLVGSSSGKELIALLIAIILVVLLIKFVPSVKYFFEDSKNSTYIIRIILPFIALCLLPFLNKTFK